MSSHAAAARAPAEPDVPGAVARPAGALRSGTARSPPGSFSELRGEEPRVWDPRSLHGDLASALPVGELRQGVAPQAHFGPGLL